MNLRKIIKEEVDDFDWARGEVIFTINEILGKKCSYRENNLGELEVEYDVSMFDLSRGDLKLGPIRYDESLFWWITGLKGNNVTITLLGGNEISDYTIEEVEQYVNLGIWVLFDDKGNVLNDIPNKNLNESQDDFSWLYDNSKWSYLSDIIKDAKENIKDRIEDEYEFKLWVGELSYDDHIDLNNFIANNGWIKLPKQDDIIIDSIYIDVTGANDDDVWFSWMGCHKRYECEEINGKLTIPKDKSEYNKNFYDNHPSIEILPNTKINESSYFLDKVVSKLSLLKEDGKTEPDMEWDFTQVKQDLDKSKEWVKTKEDVKQYLKLLFQKIKSLPKTTKTKILKYVLFSFIGLVSLKELSSITKEVSPEKIELSLSGNLENKPQENIRIRQSSPELLDHLKWEEGSIREKGKPVLTAYDLGDGAYTIGYGHAVFKDPSRGDNGGKYDFLPKYNKIVPGKTRITPKQAEILLKDDIKIAEMGLNKILNDWESQGIKPKINQKMYDAMISMIFNMGIGNFRTSEFIQMVKRGEFASASQEIKKMSANMFKKYPGLKIRREKESELFKS